MTHITDRAVNASTPRREHDEDREILDSPPTSADTPTLITEQQVLFSTAAAVALPPARTRRWTDALRAMFAFSTKPAKPVYPKRHVWLENAAMSREMDRL
jgi:hypothetical protein